MKTSGRILAIALALSVVGAAPVSAEPPVSARATAKADVEAYIRHAAEVWAAVAVTRDPSPLREILADDYVGVASTTEVRDKARAVQAMSPDGPFSASKLDYVNFRHFGDTVIAQGGETLTRKDGTPPLRLIWTDVWMRRGGKWQVVASQDSVLPPAP